MKIKRFVDKDSRGAMAQARSELGPDAVILSNKRVGEQVELVAAIDLEEVAMQADMQQSSSSFSPQVVAGTAVSGGASLSDLQRELVSLRSMIEGHLSELAWQDMARKPSTKAALQARLVGLGLSRSLCGAIADQLPVLDDLNQYWETALQWISGKIEVAAPDSIINQGGIVALMGATGVGKTTTIAKLAARFAMRHGSDQVAMVTTDCYRIGGQEQLLSFSNYLDIPLLVASDASGLRSALDQLSHKRLVLVDTAGMSQRDIRLAQQFSTLNSVGYNIDTYLVLPATAPLRALREMVDVFGDESLAGALITKTDESVDLGGVLDVVIERHLPLAYVSHGQQVPDDLVPANAAEIVAHALEISGAQSAAPDRPSSLSQTLQSSISANPNMAKNS